MREEVPIRRGLLRLARLGVAAPGLVISLVHPRVLFWPIPFLFSHSAHPRFHDSGLSMRVATSEGCLQVDLDNLPSCEAAIISNGLVTTFSSFRSSELSQSI
jgi:hypothetical protein